MFLDVTEKNLCTTFLIFLFVAFLSHPKVADRGIFGVKIANFDTKFPVWQISGAIKREQSKKSKKWYTNLFMYPQGTSIPIFKPIGPFS